MPHEATKQSLHDSYDVDMHIVRSASPDMSDHDVRVFVADNFRPKFQYLKTADKIENNGDLTYDNGDFIMVNGKMFYPHYGEHGTFADDLHEREKILAEIRNDPSLYHEDAYKTTVAIEDAFAHGATVVNTAFIHDAVSNRDLMEYRIDKETGMGKIQVLNTAPDGHFHSFEHIKEIAKRKEPRLHEINISDTAFILTDATTDQDKAGKVRSSIRPELVQPEIKNIRDDSRNFRSGETQPDEKRIPEKIDAQPGRSIPADLAENTIRTAEYVTAKTLSDIKVTVQSVRQFTVKSKSSDIGNERMPQLHGKASTGEKTGKSTGDTGHIEPVSEPGKTDGKEAQVVLFRQAAEKRTDTVIRLQELKDQWQSQRLREKMVRQAIVIGIVPAALHGITEMARAKPVSRELSAKIKRSENQAENQNHKQSQKQERRVIRWILIPALVLQNVPAALSGIAELAKVTLAAERIRPKLRKKDQRMEVRRRRRMKVSQTVRERQIGRAHV
jgi:hypothetical protein